MLNIQYFLQCRPIPSSIVCGVWTLMPCSPGTVFDPLVQVCVHDSGRILALEMKQSFSPALAPTAITNADAGSTLDTLLAPCECGCQVGAPVGRCDEHLLCPMTSRTICQTFPTGACRNGDTPGQDQRIVIRLTDEIRLLSVNLDCHVSLNIIPAQN
uniref:Chitin-binding type-2 domain-containing protein n=1 Tax=Romanomermis culicivorax TaxID=13658 RepID=A0A915IG50_ROMCU